MESPSRRMIVRGGVSAGALLAVLAMSIIVLPGFLNPPDQKEVEERLNVQTVSNMIQYRTWQTEACQGTDANDLYEVNRLAVNVLELSDISVYAMSDVADHLYTDEDMFEIIPYIEGYLEINGRLAECLERLTQEAEAIHGEGSVVRTVWSDPADHPALVP